MVRDFAEGGGDHPVPPLVDPVLAGRFLAGRRLAGAGNGGSIVLTDWRSGEELASIPYEAVQYGSYPQGIALQPDGKVTFPIPRPGGFELAWGSPEEPYVHPLGVRASQLVPFAMARDRVAYRTQDATPPFADRVGVVGLDGATTAPRADAPRHDFDGERLLGIQRPCGAVVVAEWDLAGEPPQVPPQRCPPATARPVSTRLGPYRTLQLAISCPLEPALGCGGAVTVRGRRVWPRDPRARTVRFDVDAGETRTVSVPVWWSSVCYAQRGKVALTISTSSGGTWDEAHPAGRWSTHQRVSGVTEVPRACRKRR